MNQKLKPHSPLDLSVALGPLKLKNPVTTASGTFGYGVEFQEHFDIGCLGGIFVKGLTLKPRSGHPQLRIMESSSGMLNCIGLQNIGVEAFIRDKMPILRELDTAIIANINGGCMEDYVQLTEILSGIAGIAALEVNISCPNVKEGGISFGTSPDLTEKVTSLVRSHTHLPVIVKLTPNVTSVPQIAKAAYNGGAHILSLINTLLGMAIDPLSRRAALSNITGGLSGPAIKPVALRCVWETSKSVPLPIIGMGGISTGLDAIEFFIAGATAISVGTASFIHPAQSLFILNEIRDYCFSNQINSIRELVGTLITDRPAT